MRTRNFRRHQTRRTKHRCPETLPEGQEITTDQETTPPLTSGSERNNVNGGSSSPDESPSSSRKKPRMDNGSTPATKNESNEQTLEPEGEEGEEGEEKRVMFLTQYLCISLWRALESYEIWDSRIVAAFIQGPRAFTQGVTELAKCVHRKMDCGQIEAFAKTYLSRLRPTGLYSSCAEILKKTRIPSLLRSLKRKKIETEDKEETTTGDVDMEENGQLSVLGQGKYKHYFCMDEPRLIFINGPQKDDTF